MLQAALSQRQTELSKANHVGQYAAALGFWLTMVRLSSN